MQHVEKGDQDRFRRDGSWSQGGVAEGEDQRKEQRDEHAQRRAQRIIGQVDHGEMDVGRAGRLQRLEHAVARMHDGDHAGKDQRQREKIVLIWKCFAPQ